MILALTLSGLLMDGLQLADLPCALALFVWLWLPLCTRLEAHLLLWIDGRHDRTDRHGPLLPCNPTNGINHYRSQP
jgi:hypothetical protein